MASIQYRSVYTKNWIKNFMLPIPTQLLIQGQWWSINKMQRLHVLRIAPWEREYLQWCDLGGLNASQIPHRFSSSLFSSTISINGIALWGTAPGLVKTPTSETQTATVHRKWQITHIRQKQPTKTLKTTAFPEEANDSGITTSYRIIEWSHALPPVLRRKPTMQTARTERCLCPRSPC